MFVFSAGAACAAIAGAEFPQFRTNVKRYVELVDGIERKVGKLPDRTDAAAVHAHRRALADAVATARQGAQQGDIFTPAESKQFIGLLHTHTAGRQGASARKTILEDNPKNAKETPAVVLKPNAEYPEGAPLSTVPPRLLLSLPALPKGLEFRFVGKALVLRDARANLIVDYLPDALP